MIFINRSGVLAESASIQSKNNLSPIYSIGKKGVVSQEQDGPIENQFDISYYLDLNREPSFAQIDRIKNITGLFSGITISIANISGLNCYLTDYKIGINPNSLVKVDASFVSYENLTGSLGVKPTGVISISDFSGNLAMGWTTHVVSGTSYLNAPIYNFNYSFSVEWEPSYILGRQTPIQVDFISAKESFDFVRDTYNFINITGEEVARNNNLAFINNNNNDSTINLYGYSYIADSSRTTPTLSINLTGAKVQSSDFEIGVDDFGRNTFQAVNYY